MEFHLVEKMQINQKKVETESVEEVENLIRFSISNFHILFEIGIRITFL